MDDMKNLTLAHPTLIVMVGVPGAGKSFFARQFAEAHDLACISADRLRFELFNDPRFTPNEQEVVMRITNYMTDEFLASGASFILDSTFANARTQRMNIERRARAKGYKTLFIWTQVDDTTAKLRSFKRNNKKRDDQYNANMPEPAFTALAKQLTAPSSEQFVVISGKHTFPAQHKAVLRKLEPSKEESKQEFPHEPHKVITPTPTRRMNQPSARPENRRITIN